MSVPKRPIFDRPIIEARVVFADGTQESRSWSMRDIDAKGTPDVELADWMVEPSRSWTHPQDPITHLCRVPEGREQDARDWLAAL